LVKINILKKCLLQNKSITYVLSKPPHPKPNFAKMQNFKLPTAILREFLRILGGACFAKTNYTALTLKQLLA